MTGSLPRDYHALLPSSSNIAYFPSVFTVFQEKKKQDMVIGLVKKSVLLFVSSEEYDPLGESNVEEIKIFWISLGSQSNKELKTQIKEYKELEKGS